VLLRERKMRIIEVLTRVFVMPEVFRSTVAHYRTLTGGRCTLHFQFPSRNLELAAVSSPRASFLILGGSTEDLQPHRETRLTIVVDDIETVAEAITSAGATLVQVPTPVPVGFQARATHPGGLLIEYVQHTAAAAQYQNPTL
jgi:predicted enzyme related to lactoylglutathione lyase